MSPTGVRVETPFFLQAVGMVSREPVVWSLHHAFPCGSEAWTPPTGWWRRGQEAGGGGEGRDSGPPQLADL